jgi:thiamine biosynthesis lipoprotein
MGKKPKVEPRQVLGLAIAAAAVFAFAARINNYGVSETFDTADGFDFETYVSVAVYGGGTGAMELLDFLALIDTEFQEAYAYDANELPGYYSTLDDKRESVADCLVKTSALNERYGDDVNLTCGALTSLWGIGAGEPRMPSSEEVAAALGSIEGTSYHGGDLSRFRGGTRLDFGSVAKGYACDAAYGILERGTKSKACYIVSLGSSALLYGKKPGGEPFKTAIKNPERPDTFLGFIYTGAAFVSTSGGYERFFEFDGVKYEHIFDLTTGEPVKTDLTSVTVVFPAASENGGVASDFLSTLIYMDGTGNLRKYMDSDEFSIVAVDVSGNIYVSEGLDFEVADE